MEAFLSKVEANHPRSRAAVKREREELIEDFIWGLGKGWDIGKTLLALVTSTFTPLGRAAQPSRLPSLPGPRRSRPSGPTVEEFE